jgi:tetratricopeptide (TPR) repeat protein
MQAACCAVTLVSLCTMAFSQAPAAQATPPGLAGSASCRECHEKFYELWSTSFHGLAMQPFTDALAQKDLAPQPVEITIGEYGYRADLTPGAACVQERGPEGVKALPIAHAMGGKNVYYFLTPTERGMLQTLPIAFDMRKKEWFDTAASGMRHAPGHATEPVSWRDRLYTFNTSCYGCHVSQLSTNYTADTDSYHTTWAEPGINCETCHGPSEEHARTFREAPEDTPPAELKLISTNALTVQQRNDLCAPCHAKMTPITPSFMPGERFLDHYGLVTLEDPDYYPDGRDLGENYTYTSWIMSPCVKSGQLDCMHCHTSSGRYRFSDPALANNACMPCHEDHVADPEAHTHHKNDDTGGQCISCHMPKTEFARMTRSDHSMRPPMPAATMAFDSPNACNLCHTDKDAAWADAYVREWRARDYQEPVLKIARLIQEARRQDWTHLSQMLSYVATDNSDDVFKASLVRLMAACDDNRAWMVLIDAVRDISPLVRAAAAETLEGFLAPDAVINLLKATGDDFRLVRVRAAAALAALPREDVPERAINAFDAAMAEFLTSLQSRADDYASHYNLGNYYAARDDVDQAMTAYETAVRLNGTFVAPLVNASLILNREGRQEDAERALTRALEIDPASAPAHFNHGLLLAETGRLEKAETALRRAFELDPQMAEAAYNLGVILAQRGSAESIACCRKAWELRPSNANYGYTLGFYQLKSGDISGAIDTLEGLTGHAPALPDVYVLLGRIYEERNEPNQALAVYRRAMANLNLADAERAVFAARAEELSTPQTQKQK